MAVSPDTVDESRELAVEEDLTFRLVSDPDRKFIKRFGVDDPANETAWPSVVVTHDTWLVFRHISESYDKRASVDRMKQAVSGVGRPDATPATQPKRDTRRQAKIGSVAPR